MPSYFCVRVEPLLRKIAMPRPKIVSLNGNGDIFARVQQPFEWNI